MRISDWSSDVCSSDLAYKAEKPDYAFLSLHVCYYRFSHLFSPWTWRILKRGTGPVEPENSLIELLKEFQPNYCVTLIDDIPFVQWRIQKAQRFHFPLSQLLLWRNNEILLTDMLAQHVVRPEETRLNSSH